MTRNNVDRAATSGRVEELRRRADGGLDLATGEAEVAICPRCGGKEGESNRCIRCSVARIARMRQAEAKSKEVHAMSGDKNYVCQGKNCLERVAEIGDLCPACRAKAQGGPTGGQAGGGAPATPAGETGHPCQTPGCPHRVKGKGRLCQSCASKVGQRKRFAAANVERRTRQVPQCPDCKHPVSQAGKRCRRCAGLARRKSAKGKVESEKRKAESEKTEAATADPAAMAAQALAGNLILAAESMRKRTLADLGRAYASDETDVESALAKAVETALRRFATERGLRIYAAEIGG